MKRKLVKLTLCGSNYEKNDEFLFSPNKALTQSVLQFVRFTELETIYRAEILVIIENGEIKSVLKEKTLKTSSV